MPSSQAPSAGSPGAVPPLSRVRRATFILMTLVAFMFDGLMTIPPESDRDGHHWMAFGEWYTSVAEFLLLMGLLYLVLLLRRRWPLAVLLVMAVSTVLLTFASEYSQPMVGTLVALYTAASVADRPWKARVALVLGVSSLAASMALTIGVTSPEIELGLLVITGVPLAIWLFGRREYRATEAAAGLMDRLVEHGEQAAAEERRRIARELHDILAHSVSAMMMQAAGAKAITRGIASDTSDPRLDTVQQALANIEGTGSQSMRELHRLLGVLRGDEPELEPTVSPSSQPGLADMAQLAELTRQSGLHVTVHSAGPVSDLDPSVGLAAYRVAQESLANAMKHAGHGAVVDIFQNWQADRLQLQVRCRIGHEGATPGTPVTPGSGTGLHGLRERVELVGGTFVSGWVGEEFVTTAVLPLTARPTQPGLSGNGGGTSGATDGAAGGAGTAPDPQRAPGATTPDGAPGASGPSRSMLGATRSRLVPRSRTTPGRRP